MTKQTCERCKKVEHIPTFQYVKFDAEVQYLCGECWNLFRRWFFTGNARRKDDYGSAA